MCLCSKFLLINVSSTSSRSFPRRPLFPRVTTELKTTSKSPIGRERPTRIILAKPNLRVITTTESQVNVSPGKFKFPTRKRFLKMITTPFSSNKSLDSDVDQTLESSNQEDDTTELGDVALVLQELQQAPIPVKLATTTTTRRTTTRKAFARTRGTTFSTSPAPLPSTTAFIIKNRKALPFEKIQLDQSNIYRTTNYDYYDDGDTKIVGTIPEHSKVLLHSSGVIQCLDQGSFPHPISCKKFISCAKMENGDVLGWEYTCPKGLSFDPVGGICNWSAGLGCNR